MSRYGLLAYGSSTDVIGPIATSVTDAARLAAVIAGPDALHDATASQVAPLGDYLGALARVEEAFEGAGKPLAGLRVGLIKETMETRVEVRGGLGDPASMRRRQQLNLMTSAFRSGAIGG